MKVLKFMGIAGLLLTMASCGGNKQNSADSTAVEETAVIAEQPVESGIYDATYFDIKGKNARKGQFDGRVIYSVAPEQTAILVYENGNRTKIKHIIMLSSPLAQTDSVFTSTDAKGNQVTVGSDSTNFIINYIANSDTVTITHNQKARNAYSALEALEKIHEEAAKK